MKGAEDLAHRKVNSMVEGVRVLGVGFDVLLGEGLGFRARGGFRV